MYVNALKICEYTKYSNDCFSKSILEWPQHKIVHGFTYPVFGATLTPHFSVLLSVVIKDFLTNMTYLCGEHSFHINFFLMVHVWFEV